MVVMKINELEKNLEKEFKKVDEIEYFNSQKVLNAFWECGVNEAHFNATTGYGYSDIGRDKLEEVYSKIFKSEDALVRIQFISGTHAISTALFALLRPGDLLLSITGRPYDTLSSVIGFDNNASSLKSFGINYAEIALVDDDFDVVKIIDYLKNNSQYHTEFFDIGDGISVSTKK